MLPATTLTTLLAISLSAVANAQERWRVRCVDADGRPVAGAEVHVWQTSRLPDGTSNKVASGPFTSAGDGTIETPAALTYDGGNYSRWVYARVPGKLVGAMHALRTTTTQRMPEAIVRMSPSRSIRGRVLVGDGVDPTIVTVEVATLSELGEGMMPGNPFPRTSIPGLEHILPERFEARVAADGTFRFDDFPQRPFVVFVTRGEGLAQSQWSTVMMPDREMPDEVEIVVVEESVLGGEVVGPGGAPVAGVEVELRFVGQRSVFRSSWTTTTDADGRFHLSGLPAGEHSLALSSPTGRFRTTRFVLDRGATKDDLRLALEAGIEIRGVVVDVAGRPVEGVGMQAITQRNGGDQLGYVRTDPQGRFALVLPRGPTHLYIATAGIDREKSDTALDLEIAADDASLQELVFVVTRTQ